MIFIILPTSVYTLFIMRMKPNKQNTSGISNYCKGSLAGPCWERSHSSWTTPLCPVDHTVGMRWAVPLALHLLRQVETTSSSAILPWVWIRWVSGFRLLSRLYCPFKVPHATIAYTAVLGREKRMHVSGLSKLDLWGCGSVGLILRPLFYSFIYTWYYLYLRKKKIQKNLLTNGQNTNSKSRTA